ncbi:Rieske (2Fe-2S) protein [Desulfopila aestuarii]|uniref:Assimilatory nitrite reductase (NAD(P)H) small subunit n=1 Tax=Desulfopila aestuarii DSM 18488 TaxID=1121416 RepID=A0A1M7Y1R9_9BACT|nr:Rieske (2Fe-2S) protein [Desulfopila aestuarii]SHO45611.1 assimilatory nitrite reductase (NAD(P)H) small subunit [Desulfopila aestuarii DSM 18488]
MDYVKIARVADFATTRIKSYTLLGKKVAILQLEDGSFLAIEASCKHQGADLTTGELRGTVATCPRHQWMYDLASGECLNHDSLPLRKYGLRVEGETILVSLRPIEE